MYICMHCGNQFEEIDRKHYDSATGVYEEYCPNCGSDFFEEAEQCEICGDWHAVGYLNGGVCESCMEKQSTIENALAWGEEDTAGVELNGFLAWAFSPSEIEEVLKNELMKNEDLAKKYAHQFCFDDPDAFAQWFKKKEEDK